ncbi:uncharacterized protein LOC128212471 [Mya arenaria]|uniref:uncharacterized protein LOC128212471 n=1 Tax=Mya arenaria TaxID=6604 RepID=UPI0022E04E20|nr:uncharacterized protein LOC128212471 [Mya arenaria]
MLPNAKMSKHKLLDDTYSEYENLSTQPNKRRCFHVQSFADKNTSSSYISGSSPSMVEDMSWQCSEQKKVFPDLNREDSWSRSDVCNNSSNFKSNNNISHFNSTTIDNNAAFRASSIQNTACLRCKAGEPGHIGHILR